MLLVPGDAITRACVPYSRSKFVEYRMIVFVNRFAPPDIAATAQLIGDLAHDLATRFEVVVVAGEQQYEGTPAAGAEEEEDGMPKADPPRADPAAEALVSSKAARVRFVRLATSSFGRARLLGRALDYLSFHVAAGWWLLRNLRRGDVVVALTDPPLISVVAGLAAQLRGAVLVNWVQDFFPEIAIRLGEPRVVRMFGGAIRALRDWSLHKAAINVAIGTAMAGEIAARGVDMASLRTIHNWAHEEAAWPYPRVALDPAVAAAFVVMYAGNLGRAHDAATLLEAATLLRDRTDVDFVVVGGGHGNAWLRAEARARGLNNMRFEGYAPLDRLGEMLAGGDLHVVSLLPQLEGLIMPSKFYGIAAAARPIAFVGDPAGELAGIVERGACGIVVRAGDSEALARGIVDLAARPAHAREMGSRAHALLESEFSRSSALQRWTNLLDDVHVARHSQASPHLERSNRES